MTSRLSDIEIVEHFQQLRMQCDARRAERYEQGTAERRRKAMAEEAAALCSDPRRAHRGIEGTGQGLLAVSCRSEVERYRQRSIHERGTAMTIEAAQLEIGGSSRPQKRMRGGVARSLSSLTRFMEPKEAPKQQPKER
ncbi:MAG: hypothetical protein E5Y67_25350 [Mesorhizobium sp.]|uniref:hypothetical protein n=1 Tax=Mesorhizobium sp. TaxID=1871066 RepID=UPI0012034A21|nr:hypothetical protein [Mesorhizobium sp.]TIM10970.1 MAG: hypothetical protein E5Y67_25350 [Mesorhizobium sp.]